MSNREYYLSIDSIVHHLIYIADMLLHHNSCPTKDKCEAIQKARTELYSLREQILDLLTKENA